MKTRALVANTRGEPPGGPLASALRARGLESLHCPTVAFEPPENPGELAEALGALERIDWVIFTSAHAVDATCSQAQWRASAAGHALPRLAAVLAFRPDDKSETLAGIEPLHETLGTRDLLRRLVGHRTPLLAAGSTHPDPSGVEFEQTSGVRRAVQHLHRDVTGLPVPDVSRPWQGRSR